MPVWSEDHFNAHLCGTPILPHVSWLLIDIESRNRYQMIVLTMFFNHVIRYKKANRLPGV